MKQTTLQINNELAQLCSAVRALVTDEKFDHSTDLVRQAMERYPHAPQPHNLLGIILEKTGDHMAAMKHFRAAWALDPSYAPVNYNLQTYATFYSCGSCAFDESDVPASADNDILIEYDTHGIGRAVHKARIVYDSHGIGHVIRR